MDRTSALLSLPANDLDALAGFIADFGPPMPWEWRVIRARWEDPPANLERVAVTLALSLRRRDSSRPFPSSAAKD